MTTYTDVFGSATVPPSQVQYAPLSFSTSTTLAWPATSAGTDVLAAIMDLSATVGSLAITLPDASQVSTGEDILLRNTGANSFTVKDNGGGDIATIAAGEVKYLYLTDNTTAAGVWAVFTFGTGASAADASALAGYGLTPLAGTLAQNVLATAVTGNTAALSSDRTKVFAFTAGSATFTLPSPVAVGTGYFVGVKNAGNGTITVTPATGTVDGQSSIALSPDESAWLYCTNSVYYTVGRGRSTQFQFTKLTKDLTGVSSVTLTSAEASNKLLQFIGTPSANCTITVPAVVNIYYVQAATSNAYTLTIKTPSGSGATFNNSDRIILYCDGVDVVSAQTAIAATSLSLIDGSAAGPSINFSSDATTGLYKYASGQVGVASNGVVAFAFGSSENTSFAPMNWSSAGDKTTTLTNLGAAGLASPAFTGTPTAPTASAGTDNTQIASTAFAMHMQSPAFTGTPTAPTASAGTSSTQIATTAFAMAMQSPAFTGTPTAPTATLGDSSTKIATTAFVAGTAFSSSLPAQAGNNGKFVTTDGSTASWADVFPTQTGNNGKFLTTDGSTTSWAAVLASQTGNSGKFLTTDGSTTSWADLSGFVPIDSLVAYKDAGNSFTSGGATYLKTGVIATAATYPSATAWTLNDAATWVARTGNATPTLNYVARTATGNSITVICSGATGTTYLTTTDGVTFTARSLPASINPRIAFGNGVFVVTDMTATATTAYTSTDGINWTSRTVSSATNRQIMFGGGKFVSPHNTGVDTTTDGITWTAVSGAPSGISGAGAYGNGRFCTLNYTSPDGLSWNNWTSPSGMGTLRKIVFGNGVFAAYTNEADGTIWTSADGVVWTPYTPPLSLSIGGGFYDIAVGNGTFLLLSGASTATAYTTRDFITWSTVTLPSSTTWGMAVFDSYVNAFYAFDAGTTTAASSITGGSYVGSPNAVYAGSDYTKPFYVRVA